MRSSSCYPYTLIEEDDDIEKSKYSVGYYLGKEIYVPRKCESCPEFNLMSRVKTFDSFTYSMSKVNKYILEKTDIIEKYNNSIFVESGDKYHYTLFPKKKKKFILKNKYDIYRIYCDKEGYISFNIPIGKYISGDYTYYVIFNCRKKEDPTYITRQLLDKNPIDRDIFSLYKYINMKKILDDFLRQRYTIIYEKKENSFQIKHWINDYDNFLTLEIVMDIIENIPEKQRTIPKIISYIKNASIVTRCDNCDPINVISSSEIINKYFLKKYPIRYQSSWIFGCLLITLLRSIGIPTRNTILCNPIDVTYIRSIIKDQESILRDIDIQHVIDIWFDGVWNRYDPNLQEFIDTKIELPFVEFDCKFWTTK